MCWEACLVCAQCDKFKNGCSGQLDTFFKDLCPLYVTVISVNPSSKIKR